MAQKATTTTPDPELSTALGSGNEVNANAPQGTGPNKNPPQQQDSAQPQDSQAKQPAGQTCEQGGCI